METSISTVIKFISSGVAPTPEDVPAAQTGDVLNIAFFIAALVCGVLAFVTMKYFGRSQTQAMHSKGSAVIYSAKAKILTILFVALSAIFLVGGGVTNSSAIKANASGLVNVTNPIYAVVDDTTGEITIDEASISKTTENVTFTGITPTYVSGIEGLDECVWTINLNGEEIYNDVAGKSVIGKTIIITDSPLRLSVSGISPDIAKSLVEKEVLTLDLTLNVGQTKEEAKTQAENDVKAEEAKLAEIGNDMWTDAMTSLKSGLTSALATFKSSVDAATTPEEIVAARNVLNAVISKTEADAQAAKAETLAKKAAAKAELDKSAADNKAKIDLLNYDEANKTAFKASIDEALASAKSAIDGQFANPEALNTHVIASTASLKKIYDDAAAAVRQWEFTWSPTTSLNVEAGATASLTNAPVAASTETREGHIASGDPTYTITDTDKFTISKDASGKPQVTVKDTVTAGTYTPTATASYQTVVNYGTELNLNVVLTITVSAPVPTATAYYYVEGTGTNKTLNISPTKLSDSYTECEKIITGFTLTDDKPWSSDYTNIKSVVVQGNATSKIKPEKLDYLFVGLTNCESINGLSNIDTSASTSMSYTFATCVNIENLDLSSFTLNPSKMTNMEGTFLNCQKLKTISFSEKFDTSGVTTMEEMFYVVGSSVKEGTIQLDLQYFKNDNLTNVKKMFNSCNSLTNIYVDPNYWKRDRGAVEYTDTSDTFSSCSLLAGCSNTTHKTYYTDNPGVYASGEYAFFDEDDTKKGLFSVTGSTGPDYVYWGASDSNVLSISPDRQETTWNASYKLVDGLTSADDIPWIGKLDITTSVNILQSKNNEKLSLTKLDYLFAGLTNATEFTGLSNIDTTNVESMVNLFYGDAKVVDLDLTGWTTGEVDASSEVAGMFNGCSVLARIWTDSTFDFSELTSPAEMFTGCSALKATQGSKFDSAQTTSLYARHDNRTAETSAPGYFSDLSAPRLFWGQSADNLTLYISPEKTTNATTEDELPLYAAAEADIPWKPADATSSTCTTIAIQGSTTGTKIKPASMMNWFDRQKKCTTLTGLDNIDTSVLKTMKRTFRDCSLANLDLSNFATDSVTDMAGVFTSCQYLETLNLTGKFKTKNVTDMSAMFINIGSSLEGTNGTQITFPTEFDATSAQTMQTMFSMAKPKNYTLDISSFKTTNELKNTSGMFYNANNIASLTFGSGFVTTGVTTMSTMFGAVSCTMLDLTSFSNTSLTDVSNMFLQCSNLTTIYADSAKWTRGTTYTTSTDTFKGCTNLVGKGDDHQTTFAQTDGSGNYAYLDVSDSQRGLFSITQHEEVKGYWGVSADGKTLTLAPDKITGFAETESEGIIGGFASASDVPWISNVSTITTVSIQKVGGASLEPKKTNYLLAGLTALTTVNGLDNLSTTNVEEMKGMFEGCSSLDTLNISTFTNGKLDDGSDCADMFKNCSNLSKIYVNDGSFNLSNLSNPTSMFDGCAILEGTHGTKYNSSNVSTVYGRLDNAGIDNEPGYFSDENAAKLYWGIPNLNESNADLTLYISPVTTTEAPNATYAPLYVSSEDQLPLIPWYQYMAFDPAGSNVTSVQIQNPDGAKISTTSLGGWFCNLNPTYGAAVKNISGLDNDHINSDSLKIMFGTFAGAAQLTSLDLSSLNTESVVTMNSLFYNCQGLTSVTFGGNFTTKNVQDFTNTFNSCNKLENLDLSTWNVSSAKTFQSMFEGCKRLKLLNISNWNAVSANNMEAMFKNVAVTYHDDEGCVITGLDYLDTNNVNNMASMFASSIIKDLDFSNFNTENVENMSSMFFSVKGIDKLDLSNFSSSSLKFASGMFRLFSGKEIDISGFSSVDRLESAGSMFENCVNLTTILVNNNGSFRIDYDKTLDVFTGCSNLVGHYGTAAERDYGNYDKDKAVFGCVDKGPGSEQPGYFSVKTPDENKLYYELDGDASSKTLLLSPSQKDGYTDATSALSSASSSDVPWYSSAASIKNVVFEKSTTADGDALIKPKSISYWFYQCSNLTEFVGWENVKTGCIYSLDYAFANCTNLVNLDLTKVDSFNFTNMNSTFADCTNLRTIVADKSKWTNGAFLVSFNNTFDNCKKLYGIDEKGRSFLCYPPYDTVANKEAKYAVVYSGYDGDIIQLGVITDSNHAAIQTYWTIEQTSTDPISHQLIISNYDNGDFFADNTYVLGINQHESSYMPWYYDANNIKNVKIQTSNEDEKIQVLNARRYFGSLTWCYNIEGLEKIDLTQAISTEEMFYRYALYEGNPLNITHECILKTSDKLINSSRMFYQANLPSFSAYDLNTSSVQNMEEMFYAADFRFDSDHPNDAYITLAGVFSTDSVTNIKNMFSDCMGLTQINVGKSEDWPPAQVSPETPVFEGTTILKGHGSDGSECAYDNNHINADYAKVCVNSVGYLTLASSDTNSQGPVLNCLNNMDNTDEEFDECIEDLDFATVLSLEGKEQEQLFTEPETITEYLD